MIKLFLIGLVYAEGVVTVGVRSLPTTLDLFAPETIESYRLISLIHEPLARVNPATNELEPWLASKWRVRKDVIEVELRPDVPTHDGGTLTAADVVASLGAFRDPKNHAATWTPLWTRITDARVRSRLALEFRARDLDYETFKNVMTTLRVTRATGPFRARGLNRLVPFARWWKSETPEFELLIKPVADERLAAERIAKGELDVFPDAEAGVPVKGGNGFWIDLNLRREMFASADVRRALTLLWDRASLNEKLFGGARRVAIDTFDPSLPAYPAGGADAFDVARARALLEGAGWRSGSAGLKRGGRAFAFELLTPDAVRERWASFWQSALARVGIRVTLKRASDDAGLFERLKDGAYDAFAGGGGLARDVDRDAWGGGAAYNTLGFKDDEVDRGLATLAREFDPTARVKLTRALIARVRELRPQIPGLIRDHGAYLVSRALTIDPDRPFDIWRWRRRK